MNNKLNDEQIEELIHEQLVGHLGCHTDGRTYVVPISYAYDGSYLYMHTYEGLKIDMMRKNPEVCFQIDDKKNLDKWRSVILWGEFEEVTEASERKTALEILFSRNLPIVTSETMRLGTSWPFHSENFNSVKGVVFRINVHEKTGRSEESKKSKYYSS
ncbi:MAG: pyridoxamine 5'-phosphate oxidase family protein [Flavisolibacter sp.]